MDATDVRIVSSNLLTHACKPKALMWTHKLLIPQTPPLRRLIPPHLFPHDPLFPQSIPYLGILRGTRDPTKAQDQTFPLRCVSRHARDQKA